MEVANHARFMQILREKERLGAGMTAQESRLMKLVARRDKLNANRKRTEKQEEDLINLRARIIELKRKMRAEINGAGVKKPKQKPKKRVVIPKKHEKAMMIAAKKHGVKAGFLPALLSALPAILGAVPSIVGLFKKEGKVPAERAVETIERNPYGPYSEKEYKRMRRRGEREMRHRPRDRKGRLMPVPGSQEARAERRRVGIPTTHRKREMKHGQGAVAANPWLQHVKAFWREHPHLSYMQAMQEARASYR